MGMLLHRHIAEEPAKVEKPKPVEAPAEKKVGKKTK
jgi:hypothetical protein